MKRVQRKRTKDWKMPLNTIYVGRPTKWGNPFRIIGDELFCFSIKRKVLDPWIIFEEGIRPDRKILMILYRAWLHGRIVCDYLPKSPINNLDELKNKDLACWCPLDKECHADILIELLEK